MSANMYQLGIDAWSVDDRLRLIGEIWDSLPNQALEEIPDWQKEILDARLADADANPQSLIPWEEAIERLRRRS